MFDHEKYTKILQWHNGIEYFDYDLSIDWAIELIRNGVESENILIVASFSKPVVGSEIRPYISGALKELNLPEKHEKYSPAANVHYHLEQILSAYEIRKNLAKLCDLYIRSNYEKGLMPFYLLYHGWDGLEEIGENYYFEGADLNNIERITKEQAQIWIDRYVHKKEKNIKKENFSLGIKQSKKDLKEVSTWQSILNFWKQNKNDM